MKTLELKKPERNARQTAENVTKAAKGKSNWELPESANSMRLKYTVVPTDFSECSLSAVKYADDLAKISGGTIELLNVIDPSAIPDGLRMPHADWEGLMVRNALSSLRQVAKERIDELTPVHSEVRVGNCQQEICAAAQLHEADLIVMGTHGRTGLKHFVLGSTAERVVRYAPCSVLVVRGMDTTTGVAKPDRILVPVDFSRNSKLALHSAIVLARRFNATLLIVHVVPDHYPVGDYDYFDYATLEGELRESAEKQLAVISKRVHELGVAAVTYVLHGQPANQIVAAVKQFKGDLVVISTHGRTGIQHAVVGSTTERVVRHASCPVLAVRPRKG